MRYRQQDLYKIWSKVPVSYYYKLSFFQKLWHQNKLKVFVNLLSGLQIESSCSILDIGCAGGHLTSFFTKLYPQAKVTGIDVYLPLIKEAKKRFPKIIFKKADAHKLPFADDSYDLIICSETIEHLVDPAKALKEIYRILKPGGYALIEMDSGSLLFRLVWKIWVLFGKGNVWKNAHLFPFKSYELEKLILVNSFSIKIKKFSHLGMAVSFLVKRLGNYRIHLE
jgi:ubiquinone/menaquinone biosynthesis C-methylase UbiE